MSIRFLMVFTLALIFTLSVTAQRPGGQPPRAEGRRPNQIEPGPPRNGPDGRPQGEWVRPHDTNNNGNLEREEFAAAMERTFVELDRNKNGTIDNGEAVRPGGPGGGPPAPGKLDGPRAGQDGKRILPPFFFLDRVEPKASYSKQEFERIAGAVFAEMDRNGDGVLTRDEARQLPRRPGDPQPGPPPAQMQPNARFIAAELRFGDRLVKGQPFAAETVIEDTRRLFDGTTVTKQSRGAIFRDSEGRTRREQPLEFVGGIAVMGSSNKPQVLVFINDFSNQSQIFLDIENKIARRTPLGTGPGPIEPKGRADAKEESLGTKMIEGVSVEGTRTTFEIPKGQIGNDKPIQVVTERWFSKELQVLVMSRHLDPVAGEHVFKLVNIRKGEPSVDLFSIPAGFKIEGQPALRPGE